MKQQSDSIWIRRATSEDEPEIIRIQCKAISILTTGDYNPQQIKALLRSKSKPRSASEIVWVAEIAGSIIGFAATFGSLNIISAVFVEPNFTRRGIGSLLLQHLEREAINHKIPVLWVSSSLTGQNFYRANGYFKIARIYLVLGFSYIPCIHMKKRLLPMTKQEFTAELTQLLRAVILIYFVVISLQTLAEICTFYGRSLWHYIHSIG